MRKLLWVLVLMVPLISKGQQFYTGPYYNYFNKLGVGRGANSDFNPNAWLQIGEVGRPAKAAIYMVPVDRTLITSPQPGMIVCEISDGHFYRWDIVALDWVDLSSAAAEVDPIANAKTITLTAGTGINIAGAAQTIGSNPAFTITNSSPDQIVSLTGIGGISITGTYPNFTIAGSGSGDGNNYPTSLVFNTSTGDLTLGRFGMTDLVESLDGRYIITETDPVWTAAIANYYTKTNLQTSGQALVHWGNITNEPTFLTGNQTITLSGDVTGSGATAITTTIPNNTVTFAKMQDLTQARLLGRYTASTGDPQEISIGSGLTLNPTTGALSATGTGGTVTSVGFTAPSVYTVTGSPITNSGTIALSFATGQPANQVLATPNGATGALGLRALVSNDIPGLDAAKIVSGLIAPARLGSGTPSATTALFGDQTYKTVLTSFTETDPIANAQTVTINVGTGLSRTGAASQTIGADPTYTLVNTAPDQVVSLTGAGTVSVTGTYPNFTVTGATGGGGTVTSVALALPSIFTVSGSPVTSTGTLTGTLNSQAANTVFSVGPSAAVPTFRALAATDIPTLTSSKISDFTTAARAAFSAGTGISISSGVVTNTDPDQTVVLTPGTGISVTGTYPTFTITNTAPNVSQSWQQVMTVGNTFLGNAVLGASGNTNGYSYQNRRNISSVNYTGSLGLGLDQTAWTLVMSNDANTAVNRLLYLPALGSSILFSPDNGTTKYTVLHTGNHVAGTAFTPTLTGANVPASFTSNAAGHVTAFTTRTLTPADIGAAPASGSDNYIQNRISSVQPTSHFWLSGIGRTNGSLQVTKDGSNSFNQTVWLLNSATTRGANFQLNADGNPGLATWIHNGTSWVKRMELFANGASTMYSGLQVTNNIAPSAGAGLELNGSTTLSWIYSYDRNNTAALPLKIQHTGGDTYINESAGNVGIGTVTPGAKLDVNGMVKIGSIPALGAAATIYLTSNAGVISSRTTAQVLSDIGAAPASGSGNYIRNTAAAIQSPGEFDIAGIGWSREAFILRKDGSNSITGGLRQVNAANSRGFNLQLNGDETPGLSTYIHNGTTWTERMRISATTGEMIVFGEGAEGISVSRPVATGGAATGGIRFNALNNASVPTTYARIWGVIAGNAAGAHNGSLAFNTFNAGAEASRMLLTSPGNLLIGTTTDDLSNRLQVSGGVKSLNGSITSTNGSVSSFISHSSLEGIVGTISNHPLVIRTNNAERVRILTDGSVDFANIPALATTATNFLTSNGGVVSSRTAAQVRTDIGAGTGNGSVSSVAFSSTDLSVSGSPITTTGTITANLNNNAVTFAKMQDISTLTLVGRYTAGTGDPQSITLGTGLSLSGTGVLSASMSGSFIENQDAAAQTANSWITGDHTANRFEVRANSGSGAGFNLSNSSGANRWIIRGDAIEGASNAGYDLTFRRQNNFGADLGVALTLNRATGNATFENVIAIRGGSPGAGKVLTSDADGDATWQSASATSTYLPAQFITDNYTATYSDAVIFSHDNVAPGATVTLPSATDQLGKFYYITASSQNSGLTITLTSSSTIYSKTGATITSVAAGTSIMLISDGIFWKQVM